MKDFITAKERITLQPKDIAYLTNMMIIAEQARLRDMEIQMSDITNKAKEITANLKTLNRKYSGV